MKHFKSFPAIILLFLGLSYTAAQEQDEIKAKIDELGGNFENLSHRLDAMEKTMDDILWYHKVGDVAQIDKVYITGPPLWKEKNPTALGAGNPVKFWLYVFIPKDLDQGKKYPLIVFPHGGVHSDFQPIIHIS